MVIEGSVIQPHRSRSVAEGQDDVDAQIAELRQWFCIEQPLIPDGVRLTLYSYRIAVIVPTFGFACSKPIRVIEGRFATALTTLKGWLREGSRKETISHRRRCTEIAMSEKESHNGTK